jgi:hypothetical protein
MRQDGRHRLEVECALVFSFASILFCSRRHPAKWFGNAFDAKAGYCGQAAAQDAIAGEAQ